MKKVVLKYETEKPARLYDIETVGDIPAGVLGSDDDLDELEVGAHVAVLSAEPVVLFKTNYGCTLARPEDKEAMVEACRRYMNQLVGVKHA